MSPRPNSQSVPVVLTDMDIPGLALARHLGRRGIQVVGLDSQRTRWSHYTRFANIKASPAFADDAQLLAELTALADTLNDRPLLVPLHDDHTLLVSRHRQTLARHYRFVLPPEDVVESIVDKARFAALCRTQGIPTPATWFPVGAEAVREAGRSARYPAILKPVESRAWQSPEAGAAVGWQKAVVVRDAAHLCEEFDRLSAVDERMVLQEVVPGPDANLHYVVAYVARDGTWCGGFVGRKLRTQPPHFGRGCYVESVEAPELLSLARETVERLGYRGSLGLEFKRDDRDGDWKLLEVNARFGMWDGFAADCGLDLIGVAYEDALEQEPRLRSGYAVGRRWLNIPADIFAARGYMRQGELKPGAWAASVLQPHVSPYYTWDDPLPGLARFVGFVRDIAVGGTRALGRRFRHLFR